MSKRKPKPGTNIGFGVRGKDFVPRAKLPCKTEGCQGKIIARNKYGFCRECARGRAAKRYHAAHPERAHLQDIKAKYGLTPEQFRTLVSFQNNVCAICGLPQARIRNFKHLCVDHCHETGKVRGLLCMPCNAMLGQARDSVETLTKAIHHLHNGSNVVEEVISRG